MQDTSLTRTNTSYWRTLTILLLLEFFMLGLFYFVVVEISYSTDFNKMIDIHYDQDAFNKDFIYYNFKTSLFDVLVLVIWRLLANLFAYSACRSTNRCCIVVTILVSTVYLIVKIILHSFIISAIYVRVILEFAFLFIALISHWIILCYFECQYRKAELKSPHPKGILALCDFFKRKQTNQEVDMQQNERDPLLNPNQSPRNSLYGNLGARREQFFSPVQSPRESPRNGSPIREDSPVILYEVLSFNQHDVEYRRLGEEAVQITTNYLTSTNWGQEAEKDGIICYSRRGKRGKMYKCEGVLQINPERLSTFIYDDFENQTRWNSEVAEAQILKRIDDQTDICYILASKQPGGVITQRDFVQVRYICKRGNDYYIVVRGIDYAPCPPKPGLIRGENRPGSGIVMQAIPTNLNASKLTWIMEASLNGWIPQYVIDQTLSSIMIRAFQSISHHVIQELANTPLLKK